MLCSPSIPSSLIKSKRTDIRITSNLDCKYDNGSSTTRVESWIKDQWAKFLKVSWGPPRRRMDMVREQAVPPVQLAPSDVVEELYRHGYCLYRIIFFMKEVLDSGQDREVPREDGVDRHISFPKGRKQVTSGGRSSDH
ncbi:hypothetical protein NL676_031701 [Syzygium grande]|nr:hypothetical protein NL676_031701 [Syzygium grande]